MYKCLNPWGLGMDTHLLTVKMIKRLWRLLKVDKLIFQRKNEIL